MKIFDISQEVFGCEVYPGDPVPQREMLCSMAKGDLYHLTAFRMCTHNGTHIDAPFHFFAQGKTVEQLDLAAFIGSCYVAECEGLLSAQEASRILQEAREAQNKTAQRILLKGAATVTLEAAQVFSLSGLLLLGGETQSIGPIEAPMRVHQTLLGAQIVLLEGLVLSNVPQGVYILSAAPLNLAGADGAPCRAVLLEM